MQGPAVCSDNQRKVNAVKHSFTIRIFYSSLKISSSLIVRTQSGQFFGVTKSKS